MEGGGSSGMGRWKRGVAVGRGGGRRGSSGTGRWKAGVAVGWGGGRRR